MIQALLAASREPDYGKRIEQIKNLVVAYDPWRDKMVENALQIANDALNFSVPRFHIWGKPPEVEIVVRPVGMHSWSICPSCKSRNISETILYSCSSMECRDCGHKYTDWATGER